ncbi:hypothetical protein FACS1894163_05070 [Spirochaetia bacterium]|nr:hypothetical protein FACS1894163_05070 [Spirochaetia bacterium]
MIMRCLFKFPKSFFQKFGSFEDGKASGKVVDRIVTEINNEECSPTIKLFPDKMNASPIRD